MRKQLFSLLAAVALASASLAAPPAPEQPAKPLFDPRCGGRN